MAKSSFINRINESLEIVDVRLFSQHLNKMPRRAMLLLAALSASAAAPQQQAVPVAAAAAQAVPMAKLGAFVMQTGESSPVNWNGRTLLVEAWTGNSGWGVHADQPYACCSCTTFGCVSNASAHVGYTDCSKCAGTCSAAQAAAWGSCAPEFFKVCSDREPTTPAARPAAHHAPLSLHPCLGRCRAVVSPPPAPRSSSPAVSNRGAHGRSNPICFIEHRLPTGSQFAIPGSHTWCVHTAGP